MTVWKPKDPDEVVAFVDDWQTELRGDSVSDFDFTVSSGTATVYKTKLSGYTLTYWIDGGTDGETCEFLTTVTTASGQVLERTFSLAIIAGADSFQPTTTTKSDLVEQALDRKSTRLNSSHIPLSRMPSSA